MSKISGTKHEALAVYEYNHKKVRHSEDEFARAGWMRINGIESYWSWAKRRLGKFNVVRKTHFARYLLECVWRFNHRSNLAEDLRKCYVIFN